MRSILFLFIFFSWHISHADLKATATVSEPAREFLNSALPFDLSQVKSAEDWARKRTELDRLFDKTALLKQEYQFSLHKQEINGIETLVVNPGGSHDGSGNKVIYYIHGGAYVVGSPMNETAVMVPVAHLTGYRVIAVKYRLAPEHPYPAGLDDVLQVYKGLLKEYSHKNIAVAGLSAGGALALSLVLRAKQNDLPLPAVMGLISPWTDLTKTGDTYTSLEGISPVLHYEKTLRYPAEIYAGMHDKKHPLISPVYADYDAQFPATLIQVGTRDLFLSNCARLQRKMEQGRANVKLSLWEGMWHAFQMNPALPESKLALKEMADYFKIKMEK